MNKVHAAVYSLLASGFVSAVAACGSSEGDSCSGAASALSVCAKGAVIKGVDVSYYQGTIDWVKVKGAGVDFALSRVSDGTGFIDPKFGANWAGSKKAGLVRGTYQFFEPAQDPIKQADLLFSEVLKAGGFVAGDLPPVLDIEVTGGLSPAQIQASMTKWLTYVEAKIGRKPIIYTAAFMSSNVGTGFAAYPLWVANYGPACPTMPTGWTQWVAWQYSDKGTVSGIPSGVDLNQWNGTLADLMKFADPPALADAGAPKDAGAKDSSTIVDSGGTLDARPPDASVPVPAAPCVP